MLLVSGGQREVRGRSRYYYVGQDALNLAFGIMPIFSGIVQEKNGGVSVLLGNGLTTLCATLALLVAKLYYYCH